MAGLMFYNNNLKYPCLEQFILSAYAKIYLLRFPLKKVTFF